MPEVAIEPQCEVGVKYKSKIDPRNAELMASYTVRDVMDLMIELITNCDDSYRKLDREKGLITIEHFEMRPTKKTLDRRIIVRDRAEGFDQIDMETKLRGYGGKTSDIEARGMFGTGPKNCTKLGKLRYESIKNGKYYSCLLENIVDFTLEAKDVKPKTAKLAEMGLEPGQSGTMVTFFPNTNTKIPRYELFCNDLPRLYPLRRIFNPKNRRIIAYKGGKGGQTKKIELAYRPPEATRLWNKPRRYEISGFSTPRDGSRKKRPVFIELDLYRSDVKLNSDPRTRDCGLLFEGNRGIFECSFLDTSLEREEVLKNFFGTVYCPYFDALINEYDDVREADREFKPDNDKFLIDPNRVNGLNREAPFVQALKEKILAIFEGIVKNEKSKKNYDASVSDNIKKGFDNFSKAFTKIWDDEEIEDEMEDEDKNAPPEVPGAWRKDPLYLANGICLITPMRGSRIGVGRDRIYTVYVKASKVDEKNKQLRVKYEPKGVLTVLPRAVTLRPHPDNEILPESEHAYYGKFTATGKKECEDAIITVTDEKYLSAEAIVQIIKPYKNREFQEPLEFEHGSYTVKHNDRRVLTLLYNEEQEIKVTLGSEEPQKVGIVGQTCILKPVDGCGLAVGKITIKGRTLNATTEIFAKKGGLEARAPVTVVEPGFTGRGDFEFDIVNDDFGRFPAVWVDEDNKPDVAKGLKLLISSKHSSISRFIGKAEEEWPGQDTVECKLQIANIMADACVEKILHVKSGDLTIPTGDNRDVLDRVNLYRMGKRGPIFEAACRSMLS